MVPFVLELRGNNCLRPERFVPTTPLLFLVRENQPTPIRLRQAQDQIHQQIMHHTPDARFAPVATPNITSTLQAFLLYSFGFACLSFSPLRIAAASSSPSVSEPSSILYPLSPETFTSACLRLTFLRFLAPPLSLIDSIHCSSKSTHVAVSPLYSTITAASARFLDVTSFAFNRHQDKDKPVGGYPPVEDIPP